MINLLINKLVYRLQNIPFTGQTEQPGEQCIVRSMAYQLGIIKQGVKTPPFCFPTFEAIVD